MKHTYKISGMTCGGCKKSVENILTNIEHIQEVNIDLEQGKADIVMSEYIPLEALKKAFEGTHYMIHSAEEEVKKKKVEFKEGIFYCPMHCEGEKMYPHSGNCPVCGMDLVEEVGFKTDSGNEISEEEKTYKILLKKFFIALSFTLPIFIISMSDMLQNNPLYSIMDLKYWNLVQLVLSIPVVFYATWMFFQRAYASIITRNYNMFTLIGIGAGVSWLFSVVGILVPDVFPDQFKTEHNTVHSYFEAATVILTLVLLGQLLEARAHGKTNSAVKKLLNLAPNKALRINNGVEEEIGIDIIKIDDLLRVKPGERIPADGIVYEGHANIDESMVTGEPIPVEKKEGDSVITGTINGNSAIVIKAQKIGADTFLAQIVKMVNQASRSKAPIQKIVDKVASYFVPIVVIVSIITFIIWMVFGPEPKLVYAFINAVAVLIIACPCALGLATPMSIMVGVGKGAQEGVLIKNAEALEKLNKIDVLIIDKTGTITEGKPQVEKIIILPQCSESEIISAIASVNSQSEHPLAEAIVNYANIKSLQFSPAQKVEAISGKGVRGTYTDKEILVGNKKLMDENNCKLNDQLVLDASNEQSKGKTVSYIGLDKNLVGYIVISDSVKPSSKQAITELNGLGIEVIMMTGDNQFTAKSIAEQVGLDNYQANCLPEDKLAKVKELQNKGKRVAVAGDGINDAPALALSDIGIAMGTGTDIAIESAEITLVKGDLMGIVKAYTLSHKVMRNIRQNLFFALIYNTLGIPLAAGALFPFFGILLSPMIAALSMSFSSVSVINNALRLRGIKL